MKKSVLLLALVCFSVGLAAADDVPTGAEVIYNNVAPILVSNIPDQTLAINVNLTDAFNLDDYFSDSEPLTYNSSTVNNITVVINSSTNKVSFHPDLGFQGVRQVVFTAFDGFETTDSNVVTLNVISDNVPPSWTSLSKSVVDTSIFQNTIVSFSSNWTDNVALSHFIFSIKQQNGWTNQSPVNFSGTQNVSSSSVQISAPAGTLVEWKVYAFDASGNMNSTSTQNFTVSAKQSSTTPQDDDEDEDDEDTAPLTLPPKTQEKIYDFTTEPAESYTLEIKQGASGTITVKITNTGNTDITFTVEVTGLESFKKTISENNFVLKSKASKTVTIEFASDRLLAPDVYYGAVKITSENAVKEIPVAIIVKPIESEIDLSVEVLGKSGTIRPGDSVKSKITLTNLKDVEEKETILYYAITDFFGNVIDSATEEFIFSQTSITLERELSLPEQLERGEYLFIARVISGEETMLDSDSFEVGERFNVAGFVKANFLIMMLMLASAILAIAMIRHHRSKERLRLLNLYLMVTELNKLIKEGKYDEAIEIYVKIKSAYGEHVSDTSLKNKEELKKEMNALAKKLELTISHEQKQAVETDKKDSKPPTDKKESSKPEETPKTEESSKTEAPPKPKEQKEKVPAPVEKKETPKTESTPKEKKTPEKTVDKPKQPKPSPEKKVKDEKSKK